MVRAVSDTGPINYLIPIQQIHILSRLFDGVSISAVVRDELSRANAPDVVRQWIAASPAWLSVERDPDARGDDLDALDDGERKTIDLAAHLACDIILMDDRAGVSAARSPGFVVTGTLGLLVSAARGGYVDLQSAFARLRATSFHARRAPLEELLARHGNDGQP